MRPFLNKKTGPSCVVQFCAFVARIIFFVEQDAELYYRPRKSWRSTETNCLQLVVHRCSTGQRLPVGSIWFYLTSWILFLPNRHGVRFFSPATLTRLR